MCVFHFVLCVFVFVLLLMSSMRSVVLECVVFHRSFVFYVASHDVLCCLIAFLFVLMIVFAFQCVRFVLLVVGYGCVLCVVDFWLFVMPRHCYVVVVSLVL